MRHDTLPALLPRAQRRNRRFLAGVLVALGAGAAWAAGQGLHRSSSPLLMSVDELISATASSTPWVHAANQVKSVAGASIARHDPLLGPGVQPAPLFQFPSTNQPPVETAAAARSFNGRPLRAVKTLTMTVTAYSPDERSCGDSADGITASGYSVWTNGMRMAAADTSLLPFGTLISVPGYDGENIVPVLDRGGKIKGHRLDMLYPTHEQARHWGVQELQVTVWEYADGLPHDYQPIYHADSSVNGSRVGS